MQFGAKYILELMFYICFMRKPLILLFFIWCSAAFGQGRFYYKQYELQIGGYYAGYVSFDDKAQIRTDSGYSNVGPLLSYLSCYHGIKLEMTFITCNMKQGLTRMANFKQYFVNRGIDSARIIIRVLDVDKYPGYRYSRTDIANMKSQAKKEEAREENENIRVDVLATNFNQESFKWNDKIFHIGSKRNMYLGYQDNPHLAEWSGVILDTLVNFLKNNPPLKVEIANHFGPAGAPQFNMKMSQERAQSCIYYLISKGIDSARLVAKGYGSSSPLPGCSAADISKMKTADEKEKALQSDRRTEVKILSLCYKHERFDWSDTVFYVGSRRRILIEYDLDKSGMLESSKLVLDSVVFLLKKNPALKIEIGAHTDPRGSVPHNMRLTQARAQTCVDYIISKGIDYSRIIGKGYGFTQPLPGCSAADIAKIQTPQEKETAWQVDRRTEIMILEK